MLVVHVEPCLNPSHGLTLFLPCASAADCTLEEVLSMWDTGVPWSAGSNGDPACVLAPLRILEHPMLGAKWRSPKVHQVRALPYMRVA